MKLLNKYKNGNCTIEIYSDGTRITEWPDNEPLKLEYPLNVDIRLMTKCPYGLNPKTGKAVCSFCHESATTDGKECDYDALLKQLEGLPKGAEIAIGMNDITEGLYNFLFKCKENEWIVNATVNQRLVAYESVRNMIYSFIEHDLIKGLGISYRPEGFQYVTDRIKNYENTVFHVIAGIDDFDLVRELSFYGVKKILVLGEKDFGLNKGKVNLDSESHKTWKARIMELTERFDVVSFDNLALKQLGIKEKLNPSLWEEFYQGEHSFYINAVDQYFAPSSRSNLMIKKFGEITLKEYFQMLETQLIDVKDINA